MSKKKTDKKPSGKASSFESKVTKSMVDGFSEVMKIEDEDERAKAMADHNEEVLDGYVLQYRQGLDPRHPYLWDRPITLEDFVKAAYYPETMWSDPVFALVNIFRMTGQWCKEDEERRGWPHHCGQCVPCLQDEVHQLNNDIVVLASPDKMSGRWEEIAEAVSHESTTDTLVALVIRVMKQAYQEGYEDCAKKSINITKK